MATRPAPDEPRLEHANELLSLDPELPTRERTQRLGPGPMLALEDPAHASLGLAEVASWFRGLGVFEPPTPPDVAPRITQRRRARRGARLLRAFLRPGRRVAFEDPGVLFLCHRAR